MNIKKILETWKFRGFIFPTKNKKIQILPELKEKGVPVYEWNKFFNEHGLDLYEIVKKMSVDAMLTNDRNLDNDIVRGNLGADMLLEFIKRLSLEIRAESEVKESE